MRLQVDGGCFAGHGGWLLGGLGKAVRTEEGGMGSELLLARAGMASSGTEPSAQGHGAAAAAAR